MTRTETTILVAALAGIALVFLSPSSAAALGSSAPSVTAGRAAAFLDFATAISVAEGFGVPGKTPTIAHNPGDLILSGTTPTVFASDSDGWAALYHQLDLIANGTGAKYGYTVAMTIAQMARVWTATEPDNWAANVANTLQSQGYTASVDAPIGQWLS